MNCPDIIFISVSGFREEMVELIRSNIASMGGLTVSNMGSLNGLTNASNTGLANLVEPRSSVSSQLSNDVFGSFGTEVSSGEAGEGSGSGSGGGSGGSYVNHSDTQSQFDSRGGDTGEVGKEEAAAWGGEVSGGEAGVEGASGESARPIVGRNKADDRNEDFIGSVDDFMRATATTKIGSAPRRYRQNDSLLPNVSYGLYICI